MIPLKSFPQNPSEVVMALLIPTSAKKWAGKRNMVDLMEVVLNFYYHPKTQGKNGPKYVLPATLAQSKRFQEKWSKPTYNSANFKNHAWVTFDAQGEVVLP
jgi:hypothetical protein